MIFSDHKEWKIVAEAKDGTEVLNYFNTTKIDLAILDVNMPKPNGFDLSKNIKQNFPNCKIMILSMYGDEQFMNEFVKMGVHAYVLKNAGKQELLEAMNAVLNNETYISKALRSTNENDDSFVKSLSLTQREKEIITLLAKEKSSQEIADALFISIYTVNTHRKNILHKLGIKNTAGLMKFASENNLL
jgi:DNA-binding NarL/FixJ family response regulator